MVLSTAVGNTIVAMVIDLWRHWQQSMATVYAMIPSNYKFNLPEIHTLEKCDFLKPIINSKVTLFYVK